MAFPERGGHSGTGVGHRLTSALRSAGERVFTLEYGWNVVDDVPYTVLASWAGGAHYNHGDGPEPDPEAFLAAVAALAG